MFKTDAGNDERSKLFTRRAFVVGGVAVAGVAAAMKLHQAPGVEASTTVHGTPGDVTIVNFANDGKRLDKVTVAKVIKTDGQWQQQLGQNSFGILRKADTEMPFTNALLKEHDRGVFRCLGCETALFDSKTKFDSGTGWPSFWAAIAKENVIETTDSSLGMDRTEVKCRRCEGHLGHVFNDGPEPTGLRYCMNGAAMSFSKA